MIQRIGIIFHIHVFLEAFILTQETLNWWKFYGNNTNDNGDNIGKYKKDMILRCQETFNQLWIKDAI